MNIKSVGLVSVVSLAVGLGFGWQLGHSGDSRKTEIDNDVAAASVDYNDMLSIKGDDPAGGDLLSSTGDVGRLQLELASLLSSRSNMQVRIASLEMDLFDARARIASLQSDSEDEETKQKPRLETERRNSREGYMERLKQENPERYAEMQKRREEFQAKIQHGTAERAMYMLDVDTSRMTEEQLQKHEQLVETLGVTLRKMDELPNLEGDAARDARHEFHENIGKISELFKSEREYLLLETARELGYSEGDASGFSEYIEKIYNMTSVRGMFPGRGRR